MPLDRSKIYKGAFITSTPIGPDGTFVRPPPRHERDKLQRQYPEFADPLKTLGPSPEEARLAALEASNREVEARIAALRERAQAFLKATGRK